MTSCLRFIIAMLVFSLVSGCATVHEKPASNTLLEDARLAQRQGNIAGAIDYYQQLLKQGTHNRQALEGLALQQEQIGNFKTARELWQRLIAVDPNFLPAYNKLGFMYLREENYALAMDYFKRCVARSNPDDREAIRAHKGIKVITAHVPYFKEQMIREDIRQLQGQVIKYKALKQQIISSEQLSH